MPLFLLLAHCEGSNHSEGSERADGARVETRLSAAGAERAGYALKFRAGAASSTGLESLKYQITSIQICESLETSGSAFHNPVGCLSLYEHDDARLHYELDGDWRALADVARGTDEGFVDLLDDSSRAQLAGSTKLRKENARSYHYGVINWSLPIKVKATVTMSDGSQLYTHDGETRVETIGVDNWRSHFTAPMTPLSSAPAEEAVVLLPNGGNWFKFQSPFVISEEDIASERAFVLDLVFNPDGIVKGYSDSSALGSISQRGAGGEHVHDIAVPMLDLAPVPHRASEQVMRESYRGTVALSDSSFDLRIELYYLEGDASETVYGADAKALVNAGTRAVPPELTKISFLERAPDGSLTMLAHRRTPVISGLRRVAGESGSTRVSLACAEHSNREAAQGGAAIVLERCPAATLDVDLVLTSRSPVAGAVAAGVGGGVEPEDAGVSQSDAAR